jgi:hypothetical protein
MMSGQVRLALLRMRDLLDACDVSLVVETNLDQRCASALTDARETLDAILADHGEQWTDPP